MAVLVTGGAGYIGSHTVAELLAQNEEVIVLDNLEKGHKEAVLGGKFIQADLRNIDEVRTVFKENDIDAVIHFAAYIEVGESVADPLKYYGNNVLSSLNLLTAMQEAGVKKIVFSSTAATYGVPESIPIKESDKTAPINPYGETKLAVEKLLKWADGAYGIKHAVLRYFNACGAHISGKIGEAHSPESHLIPIILQVAQGKRDEIKLFGSDYDTFDGTCVRDYIHVSDLAQAHVLALKNLRKGADSDVFNLGNGKGFSNRQVVEVAREVTGLPIKAVDAPRRPGDPATLVASSEKAINVLGWTPQYNDLHKIIETAWNWHKNNPDGYISCSHERI